VRKNPKLFFFAHFQFEKTENVEKQSGSRPDIHKYGRKKNPHQNMENEKQKNNQLIINPKKTPSCVKIVDNE